METNTEGAEVPEQNSDRYIPTVETDPQKTMAALRRKLREAHSENEKLKKALSDLLPIAEQFHSTITMMWPIREDQETADHIRQVTSRVKTLLNPPASKE